MKYFLLLLLLLQADNNQIIKKIRERYVYINAHIGNYTKQIKDIPDQSTEGGDLTSYFAGDSLVKAVTIFYGEMGKAVTEYYFEGNKVVFIYQVDYQYVVPIYDGTFDRHKTTSFVSRYYFYEGQLIKGIDTTGREMTKEQYRLVFAALQKEEAWVKKYSFQR
ncbi:hypothetical protein ACDQ55_13315 [Chitinophaga sp. 30R24]|uniref:hypothetical protein n=1 Tax=Chitinophaga sp. 30R24 TaxID=3248838 RepID=UPI003B8FB9C0